MGSFSWTRAEHTTKRSNIAAGDKYKILVPKEFGGGYIIDIYWDCGRIFAAANDYSQYPECGYYDAGGNFYSAYHFRKGLRKDEDACSLYGLLAWWNKKYNKDMTLHYRGSEEPADLLGFLERGETFHPNNCNKGTKIEDSTENFFGNYHMEYPLKLVSMSCEDTYESCPGKSFGDPGQGFSRNSWDQDIYKDILDRLIKAEDENKKKKGNTMDSCFVSYSYMVYPENTSAQGGARPIQLFGNCTVPIKFKEIEDVRMFEYMIAEDLAKKYDRPEGGLRISSVVILNWRPYDQ